jgi:flagellar basal body-associated protein FliL
MAYLKIIGLGLLIMVLVLGGTIIVGYFYAKNKGIVKTPEAQKKKEQNSYEAFVDGNLDSNDDDPFQYEQRKIADSLHTNDDDDDVIVFEDDSDSEDDGFSFDD